MSRLGLQLIEGLHWMTRLFTPFAHLIPSRVGDKKQSAMCGCRDVQYPRCSISATRLSWDSKAYS